MALPDPLYVACFPLQEYFVDKDSGLPLAAGIVTFYKDTERTVLKTVYEQIQLPDNTYQFVAVNNPITLTSVGTFGDDSGRDFIPFLFPYDADGNVELYYITVYSSTGVLQFTREAWPPNSNASLNPTDLFEANDNQIENPQFVEISYTPDPTTNAHIYTVSGSAQSVEIAPDWSIVTDGSGTVTVEQLALTDNTIPSLPPYSIKINGTGITSLKLRQRITESPRIMGLGFIWGTFVAKSFSATEVNLIMDYVASNGYSVNLVNSLTTTDGLYTTLSNASAATLATTNTDSPTTGYVNIDITIPVDSTVAITSVQIVSVQNNTSSTPFLQISEPRQVDHLFHYYEPKLKYKPIPSYLIAWDFPLNPTQFGGPTVVLGAIGGNKSKYVWDQTIVFQSANSGINVSRGASQELLLTAAASTKMAIVQYLEAPVCNEILNSPLCVNVSARASVATIATVSLWYTIDATLPVVSGGTNNSLVATLDASGKPATFNGNWTEVPRLEGDAKFQIGTSSTTNFNDYAFSFWDMQGIAACDSATFFAIVVGTESIPAPQTVGFNSVSLQAGYIPTRPAPLSRETVYSQCEWYYETSKEPLVALTTSNATNALIRNLFVAQLVGPDRIALYAISFSVTYRTIKRATPTFSFYTPGGTNGDVTIKVREGGAEIITTDISVTTGWNGQNGGRKGEQFLSIAPSNIYNTNHTNNNTTEAYISFHYEAECRLGVV